MLHRHDYSEFSQPLRARGTSGTPRATFNPGSTGVGYGHKGADFSPGTISHATSFVARHQTAAELIRALVSLAVLAVALGVGLTLLGVVL